MAATYLVTGGMGCIGAWALTHLQRSGKRAVNFDLSDDRHRINWLLSAEQQADISFVQGDLRDTEAVKAVFVQHDITHVIHLAALQVPFCRANPPLGAEVNVTGTVNVFEAARAQGIGHIAYASSIGVYGPPSDFPPGLIAHDAPKRPRTLYGAYKVCNEGTALVYFEENGISSTALRPYTVYGVGRDQGMTSEPTHALVAAVKGQPYQIGFSGTMQFQLASDVARQFILAAEQPLDGRLRFQPGRRRSGDSGRFRGCREACAARGRDRGGGQSPALPGRLRRQRAARELRHGLRNGVGRGRRADDRAYSAAGGWDIATEAQRHREVIPRG